MPSHHRRRSAPVNLPRPVPAAPERQRHRPMSHRPIPSPRILPARHRRRRRPPSPALRPDPPSAVRPKLAPEEEGPPPAVSAPPRRLRRPPPRPPLPPRPPAPPWPPPPRGERSASSGTGRRSTRCSASRPEPPTCTGGCARTSSMAREAVPESWIVPSLGGPRWRWPWRTPTGRPHRRRLVSLL